MVSGIMKTQNTKTSSLVYTVPGTKEFLLLTSDRFLWERLDKQHQKNLLLKNGFQQYVPFFCAKEGFFWHQASDFYNPKICNYHLERIDGDRHSH